MLDTETKRRIDTCRDILVGKVPDPKSQVEQITIALIYKFMDDMDAESEELGGKRSFFAGEYAKYGWAKLMTPTLGGFDVIALYSEAITTMNTNPGVPVLFREIFKNAYLPYRDPETLRAFLKEINGFTYDHSERLGDAFEYLLSVLGSQGDAGQFRTPRHIIDFIVDVVDPQKTDTILDPACGTAGFLISSYKHILAANQETKLTADERSRLARNLIGYDISPDMVRLSLVNLYLHGFPQPQIEEYDTLTSDEKWNEYADVILANPPFMSPKGGIKPHKRFSVQSNRSEVLFVDYIAEHLTPNGRAGVIVPEGVIFQSGTAYKSLRKMLVEKHLIGVVSLPAGVFHPYSGVKTSILIMDRRLAKQSDSILFVKIASDGFGLGAQRRAVVQNDLPEAARHIKAWRASLRGEIEFDASNLTNVQAVTKSDITANGDYNLSGDRYKQVNSSVSTYPTHKLSDLCMIERGASPRPIQDFMTNDKNGVNWVKIGDALPGAKFISSTKEKVTPEGAKKSRAVKIGDFVLSNSMSFGRPYIMNTEGCIHDGWLLLRPDKDCLDKNYLHAVLGSDLVYKQFQRSATGGVVNNLNAELVKNVEIPLPPMAVQQEIVAEIEQYQKIIDGARQVVENYKPKLQIKPDWPVAELGDICTVISGQHIDKEDYNTDAKGYCYLTGPADFGSLYPVVTKWTENPKVIACSGDVLITVKGSGLGKVNLLNIDNTAISRQLMAVRSDFLQNKFLYTILASKYGYFQSLANGAAIPGITRHDILTLEIPLPDLETQQAIVKEIEEEQTLVAANKELMERFEAKIKATIDRVWGE